MFNRLNIRLSGLWSDGSPHPGFHVGWQPQYLLVTVGILSCLIHGGGYDKSWAAPNPTPTEPLITRGQLPPENVDGPYQYWKTRKKYFLVIAVDQTDVPQTDLAFARVDGDHIVKSLTHLGYQPLDPTLPILTGKNATNTLITKVLKTIRKKKEHSTIVIYYTGHGAVGPKDLWLQTYELADFGYGQGVPVSKIFELSRGNNGYEGELMLILDACYSGKGLVSQGLNLGDFGLQSTILTSSSDIQESFSLNQSGLPEMSAFTYTILRGMGPEWEWADRNGDGLLLFEELRRYAIKQLREFKDQGALTHLMKPAMLTNKTEGFLAYRRDQVRVWQSDYRDDLTATEMNSKMAANLQRLGASRKEKPVLPKDVQVLAQGLNPGPEDFYTQAVKATAEGRIGQARTLFAQAEKQSQERETQADAVKQQQQGKRVNIYLARARMESYDGKFTDAFTWYQQAAKIRAPTSADLINEFGQAGMRAGKYSETEPYLTQALEKREHILEPNHPDIGASLNNLAILYKKQGKYAEAEPLYLRALQIDEAALGANHPEVAIDLNNLAELYRTQSRYAEAEPLYLRALRINEAAHGTKHPKVAVNLNNLAALNYSQGQYAKAEPLFLRALRIREAALGPDHPYVGLGLNNLALVYKKQGKYAEAEPLYLRALQIDEAALGANHPEVAIDLNNLAVLYNAQGKYAEAEPLYLRALQIDEVALGANHPGVAIDMGNLASLYQDQGKHAKAEPLFQRSYWILVAGLGPKHPKVKIAFYNYQAMLKAKGAPHSAAAVIEKLKQAKEHQVGVRSSP